MDAHSVSVKSESPSVQDMATRTVEDTARKNHCALPKAMANKASYLVLVKSIPSHLDAWVILNSETRLSEGLIAMTVSPEVESNDSLRSMSLEYSGMAYAEAFMYRSAQPLLEKYGIMCSIVSQPPGSDVPHALHEQPKTASRDQAGYSTNHSWVRRSMISRERKTPTPDSSDDECFIVSSRPIKPSKGPRSSASKPSINATPEPSASTKVEPPSRLSPGVTTISMIQPIIDLENSIVPDIEAPAQTAPETSAAQSVLAACQYNSTNTSAAISTAQQRFLLSGIQRLSKRQEAIYFAQPVSFNQMRLLNIPHYPDIIKKPMDLRTMEEKLKGGSYACVDHYLSDFNQMVENSVIFNGPRHEVTKDGFALKSSFEKQIKNLVSADSTKGPIRTFSNSPRQPGRPRKWRNLEQEMHPPRSNKRGRETSEAFDDAPHIFKTNDTTYTLKADDNSPKRKKQVRQAAIDGLEKIRLQVDYSNTI
ncbi:hypothetical protein MMC18_008434 [Xylographa bjoerkii]|nr:hypothetical protein [Xylographa bjoerkii]